jgi:hypothetical protein
MSAAPPVYAQARAETAAMLGYDLASLTAEQATRLDVAAALRLAVDDQSGKLARGETADVTKLLSASEALARLLPPLREPPPAVNEPDPREIMWQTYLEGRRRGHIPPEGLLQGRINEQAAEIERLKAELAGKTSERSDIPAGDNVVKLVQLARPTTERTSLRNEVSPSPPAAAPPSPPKPAPPTPQPTSWDDTEGGRAWNQWRDSGGYGGFDPWGNHNV